MDKFIIVADGVIEGEVKACTIERVMQGLHMIVTDWKRLEIFRVDKRQKPHMKQWTYMLGMTKGPYVKL